MWPRRISCWSLRPRGSLPVRLPAHQVLPTKTEPDVAGGAMSSNRQVSHPSRQRPTLGDVGRKKKDHTPKTDRGWGGAGAVGWGVLGAFGSLEKDTGAQVVRKTSDANLKMVKNDKGLWVKVKADDAPGAGRGRGRGIPALGGSGDVAIGGLQDDGGYDDDHDDHDRSGGASHERGRSPPPPARGRRRSPSLSRSSSRDRPKSRKRSPSDSRSPSRSRRKRHSRSRSRSRGRGDRRRHSRSRSPARHRRHHSRSRSPRGGDRRGGDRRSRSRERKERRRSRSRDRGDRRRSPSPARERKRSPPPRESAPSSSAPRLAAAAPEEEGPAPPMVFTAAQLADRLVEVYNLEAKNRLSQIKDCFANDVALCNLKTRADVLKGAEALRDSMPSDYAKWNAECSRRVYMQAAGAEPSPETPTFCLDFYPAGHAPGMNAMGKGNVKLPTVLLYRVRANHIDKVWIAPDKEDLAGAERVTEQQVLGSKLYAMVAEVVKAEVEGGDLEHVFNDYRNIETWG